jgi:hypothetical protein
VSARDGFRDRWVVEVLKADYIGDACRVLLLTLAMTMTDKGMVSVPRESLAAILGKHERRISERIAEAVSAGLLDRAGGGYRGRTSEYMAYLPAVKGAAQPHPISGKGAGEQVPKSAPFPQPIKGRKGAAQRVPNTGARGRVSLEQRQDRPHHDDSRASLDHGETTDSSEGELTANSLTAAASPTTRPPEESAA